MHEKYRKQIHIFHLFGSIHCARRVVCICREECELCMPTLIDKFDGILVSGQVNFSPFSLSILSSCFTASFCAVYNFGVYLVRPTIVFWLDLGDGSWEKRTQNKSKIFRCVVMQCMTTDGQYIEHTHRTPFFFFWPIPNESNIRRQAMIV